MHPTPHKCNVSQRIAQTGPQNEPQTEPNRFWWERNVVLQFCVYVVEHASVYVTEQVCLYVCVGARVRVSQHMKNFLFGHLSTVHRCATDVEVIQRPMKTHRVRSTRK